MPFWPGSVQKDDSFVKVLDPMELQETFIHNREINMKVNSIKQNQFKKDVIDNLTELSNPVLMSVRK